MRARVFTCASATIALALTAATPTFRAAPQGSTRAFLIVQSDLGIHYGDFEQDCPTGFDPTVEELYLATKSPAERDRLLRPENAREYANGWKNEFITGPGGENVCNNPKSFMNDPRHPRHPGVKSTVAYGLNLDGTKDGAATASTCGHQKFAGVNGEAGVDNQLYRAIGCAKMWRSSGPQPHSYIDRFLIELRGLDDLVNDDHVEVTIASTDDVPLQGADGKFLALQTLGATTNARWRTTVQGRLANGRITTASVPTIYLKWVLATWGPLGEQDVEFHNARLQLSLNPDGTLAGVLAAYRPLDNIFTGARCCKGTASTANNDCASEHKTLVALADGFPDPATGQCTMISSASNLKGIPIFLASRQGETVTRN